MDAPKLDRDIVIAYEEEINGKMITVYEVINSDEWSYYYYSDSSQCHILKARGSWGKLVLYTDLSGGHILTMFVKSMKKLLDKPPFVC